MVNCGNLLRSALVAIVLVNLAVSQSTHQKLASCCTSVTSREITEPISGYLVQKRNPPCVTAVIFQTEKGLFCCQLNAPWVRSKIKAFKKAKAEATAASVFSTSPVSLLSIITSTASPPSSSSSPLSSTSSSTSQKPADETFQSGDDESTAFFSTSSQ